FLCLERPHGRFCRTLPLDIPIDVHNAAAQLKDGLLTITIPRLVERRNCEISIPIRRVEKE
ncbi:MAG: Hsp20/alpha crystallin family protein, partial [Vicinamibacteria bacterium]|nr:Hsp20/alpha crystallin family protein [Vicinamibacteria bacterium]